jgi:TrmH family RNA methyltransferase
MLITSPANERLKQARRVRDGRESDLIFVEGERLVEECLQSKLKLVACFHSPQISLRAQTIISDITAKNIPIYPTADGVLETISDTVNSQGLIVLAERPGSTLDQIMSQGNDESPLIVCLDAVQDPGNFGTIVRTAEAAGVKGVVALKGSVEPYAPKTLRSAMGSAFRLPVVSDIGFDEILPRSQAAGIKVVATASNAETIYNNYDWRQPTLVIFGNEARGAGSELLERCDERLRIPLHAPVESINVAAAAAAVLFEAARQRRAERN